MESEKVDLKSNSNLLMDDNSVKVTCAESKLKKIVSLMYSTKTILFYGFKALSICRVNVDKHSTTHSKAFEPLKMCSLDGYM